MSLIPRTEEELKIMRKSGEITAKALKKALEAARPGVNLLRVEAVASQEILDLGAKLSFPTVDDYPYATCLTLNEEIVHGMPRDYVLKEGDLLGIDIGALYKGWHTDAAWSIVVGGGNPKFLSIGEEALWKAIKKAVVGNKIGDISAEIQQTIEGAGYSVSRQFIGHGVGRELHEDPNVPGTGSPGMGLPLKKNMTLAIETIYAEGNARAGIGSDGWTYVTLDGSLGGLFEMTVIVGEKGAEVLTDWRKY